MRALAEKLLAGCEGVSKGPWEYTLLDDGQPLPSAPNPEGR